LQRTQQRRGGAEPELRGGQHQEHPEQDAQHAGAGPYRWSGAKHIETAPEISIITKICSLENYQVFLMIPSRLLPLYE
jgi:hypothetical protein